MIFDGLTHSKIAFLELNFKTFLEIHTICSFISYYITVHPIKDLTATQVS